MNKCDFFNPKAIPFNEYESVIKSVYNNVCKILHNNQIRKHYFNEVVKLRDPKKTHTFTDGDELFKKYDDHREDLKSYAVIIYYLMNADYHNLTYFCDQFEVNQGHISYAEENEVYIKIPDFTKELLGKLIGEKI